MTTRIRTIWVAIAFAGGVVACRPQAQMVAAAHMTASPIRSVGKSERLPQSAPRDPRIFASVISVAPVVDCIVMESPNR